MVPAPLAALARLPALGKVLCDNEQWLVRAAPWSLTFTSKARDMTARATRAERRTFYWISAALSALGIAPISPFATGYDRFLNDFGAALFDREDGWDRRYIFTRPADRVAADYI